MRVSGFTIVRGGVRAGYPFEASIRSLLPLVDEVVVSVGDDDDGTWEAVLAIADPKIRPFRTTWGVPTPGAGELSAQTNAAMARCQGTWGVYLQADEVLHEADLEAIRRSMARADRTDVEGLLFRYHHFWRHPALEVDAWHLFYPRAVRAVRLGCGVTSVGDAAGFARIAGGERRGLIKAHSGASVFHYGWCNEPDVQVVKHAALRRWYAELEPVDLSPNRIFGAVPTRRFRGTHPAVMAGRLAHSEASQACTRLRLPAWVRAGAQAVRSPRAAISWARPILPVVYTNAWWRARGRWRRDREQRTPASP